MFTVNPKPANHDTTVTGPNIRFSIDATAREGVVNFWYDAASTSLKADFHSYGKVLETVAQPLAPPMDRDALWDALTSLLNDVEGGVDFGMPWEHPDNNFHESVMGARRALGIETGLPPAIVWKNDTIRESEAPIIQQCITDLLAAGFRISVSDDDDSDAWLLENSTSAAAIYTALGSGKPDTDTLFLSRPGDARDAEDAGYVELDYGNDYDVIGDYTPSLKPLLAATLTAVHDAYSARN